LTQFDPFSISGVFLGFRDWAKKSGIGLDIEWDGMGFCCWVNIIEMVHLVLLLNKYKDHSCNFLILRDHSCYISKVTSRTKNAIFYFPKDLKCKFPI
jgi:hypothetical protein